MKRENLLSVACRTALFGIFLVLVITAPTLSAHPVAETLILFDPSVPETPESIRFDRFDNAYISLALTGEIRRVARDGSQSSLAFLPIGAPCGTLFPPPATTGLTMDRFDRLYVAVWACDPANNGVWRVDKHSGETELLGTVPSGSLLNGLEARGGYIYASDTLQGLIWRVPMSGGNVELWADHALLEPPAPGAAGPNGMRFFRGELYVAVSATGHVLAFPLGPGATAGEPRIHATLPEGQGCDEFEIDRQGRIYCTTDPSNTLVRLDPDGTSEILLTAEDGLDGPTSAAFGRRGFNRRYLYITNAAFPFFTTTFRPSLMRVRIR